MFRSAPPMAAQTDDAVLFQRFIAGENAAFEVLVRRHARRLHAYCLAMLRDEEAARDIIQETWERVARLRTQRTVVENPSALLITIVRNLSLNHIRNGRRCHLSVDELSDAQHPAVSPPEQSYQEELVILALERLPIAQREVIVLHTYAGYDYGEIAAMLDISVDAARMKALRGRAHLARTLEAMMRIEEERIRDDEESLYTRPKKERS